MTSNSSSSSGTTWLVWLSIVICSLRLTQYNSCVAVFLSIDCGGSQTIKTTNSITWVPDDDYIRTGVSRETKFGSLDGSVLTTSLRSFPTLDKNCYNINLDEDDHEDRRILVRATFFYGDYDGMDSPPTFDIYFDGNFWATVNMSLNSNVHVGYEVMYFPKSKMTNICLVRTYSDQNPFINTLAIRSLDATMYSRVDPKYAMLMVQRYTYSGSNTDAIRYPDDGYDRTWYPARGVGLITVSNEASSIDVSSAEDKPPEIVFKTAATFNQTTSTSSSTTTTTTMQLYTTGLTATKVGIYMTIYFSEVTLLPSTQKRSFQVFIDGEAYSKPIIPPFGSSVQVYIANITASYDTLIELRPTPDSTLLPLINANELYTLSQVSTLQTHPNDGEGLATLQNQFEVLQMWSGDPCLPTKYTWEWVTCSSDPIPRVTALNLSGYGLFGSLPDFSSMDALVSIDLHNNTIYGPILDFLGDLPKLTLLDLSENKFNGSVPSTLSNNKKLKLLVTENCLTGMSCPLPLVAPPPPPLSTEKTNSPPGLDSFFFPPPSSGFDFGYGFDNGSTNNLANMILAAIVQLWVAFRGDCVANLGKGLSMCSGGL
ncbi:hypothetical protein CsatA_018923 [Cannabis sativa]